MKKIVILCSFAFASIYAPIYGLVIDRVILASNENPMYLNFWPLVSQAWNKRIGVRPTLFLIDEHNLPVDTTYGDVIRIKPIPGVSTASHAQIIRLLAPIYFENEISLISDIDMLPLDKEYFVNSVKNIPDTMFVIYRDLAYGKNASRFPMCYNAGKGYLFKEIFNIKSVEEIPAIIKRWMAKGLGWDTDELMLYAHTRQWPRFKTHCILLGHTVVDDQRIDRARWGYDKAKLKSNYYIDAHMVRPLDKYYKEIRELASDLGLSI